MAYSIKYLFKFESAAGTTREIRVLKDGYSGDVIQRPLGRAPMLKKQQNGPVHGTSLEFFAECNVDREFIEFYTSNPKDYRVDLYAGSTLLWQGYITPELYSEPDIAPPYDVQVVATDGVGELKLYDYAAQGTVTLRNLLAGLLTRTGLGTDIYLISSLKPGSAGAGSLLEKTINLDYMAGKTCYDVLTYVLDTLHATITWWKGAWILTRETNVTFTNGKVRYFNTAGNSALLNDSVQVLGVMRTNPAWPVGQLSTVIDPAKNKVAVQAPWHPVTCLQNPDMTSDANWTKSNGATYATDGYQMPQSTPTPGITQTLSMTGLRVPMSLRVRATGLTSLVGINPIAWLGVVLTYTVGNVTYYLYKDDTGAPVWRPEAGGNLDFEKSLVTWNATEIEAEDLTVENIPAFFQGNSFPAGTLAVNIAGSGIKVYSAYLDVTLPKGYADILHIGNGARGEGDTVEIAIGRESADNAYYAAFLQGLLLDSGSLITSFSDANFTTGMDYLAFIARDYALSVALPRARVTGTVFLESSVQIPPLVFTKGGLDYWVETWGWNLYEDELEISARTLPSASLTVQSEVILESNGSTVSSAGSAGSFGAGSSMGGGGGTNYWEIDETLTTLVKPKDAYAYVHSKDGIFFTGATLSGTPTPDLYVDTVNNQRVLRSPLPLITGGDQIVIDGTPGGGGGGGATTLAGLDDTSISNPQAGQMLSWNGTKWVNTNAPTGSITSVSLAAGATNGTLHLVVNGTAQSDVAVTGLGSMAYRSSLAASDIPDLSATYQPKDADLTAIAGLSGTSGFLKKTAANTWSLDTNTYLTGITSTMVTNALGYTPANVTALANYLPIAGGTIDGSGNYPLTIKTSSTENVLRLFASGNLVAAFAWQSQTYGAYMQNAAVTGTPYVNIASDGVFKYNNTHIFWHAGNDGAGSGLDADLLDGYHLISTVTDWNTNVSSIFKSSESHATNAPTAGFVYGLQMVFHRNPENYSADLVTDIYNGGLYFRSRTEQGYGDWVRLWHSGNANGTGMGQWAATSLLLAGAISGATSITASGEVNAATFVTNGTASYTTLRGKYNGSRVWELNTMNNGYLKLYLDSASAYILNIAPTTGNVGFGVEQPAYKVDVDGTVRATSLKIGSATITWNSNGYLHIDQPLVTAGDQIVISGTPGGGGGGGATTLAGLDDVAITSVANGQLLQYNGSKWVNVAASSVGRIYSEGTGISISAANVISLNTTTAKTALGLGSLAYLSSLAFADLSAHPTTLSGYGITDGVKYSHLNAASGAIDLNAQGVTSSEIRQIYFDYAGSANVSNRPTTTADAGIVLSLPNNYGGLQVYSNYNANTYAIRNYYTNSEWKPWVYLIHSGNYTTYVNSTNFPGLMGNQTITLSGDVSGSGETSISVSIGEGKVTNAMLAGSIANAKLANSSITIAGTAVSLGGSMTASNLRSLLSISNVENTALSTWAGTSSITTLGTITTGVWHGSAIGNSYLANSSITINGSSTSLGGSFSTASITAGTAGQSTASSGVSFSIPYVTMNAYGIVTAYGTHTHTISASDLTTTIGSTTYAPYNADGYLPLTGGTLAKATTNVLTLNNTQSAGTSHYLDLQFKGTSYARIGAQTDATGVYLQNLAATGVPFVNIASDGVFKYNNTYPFYHSGNSNKSDVAWSASSLTLAGSITGATTISASGTVSSSANPAFRANYTASSTVLAAYYNNTRQWQIDAMANGDAQWYSDGARKYVLTIGANGQVTASGLVNAAGYYGSYLISSSVVYIGTAKDALGSTYTGGCFFAYGNNPLYFYTNSNNRMTITGGGNVGIGTSSPSQKLDVAGSILSSGDQVVSSDLTLTTNLTPVTYSVKDIAKARAVEFDWKDGRGHSMGSIAQDWLGIAPALVHGEEGNMSLAYGQLALVNTIIEARAIESLQVHESEQDKEIRELRERVARLEMENERLRS